MTNINFEEIKIKLKKEFFGIDKQIDEIINHVKTWNNIKEYQVKPYVINLWGMSGVGKTKLIERIIDLCSLNENFINIPVNSNLNHIYDVILNTNPKNDNIFLIDEIQHLKNKDEEGKEISQTENKPQTDLLNFIDTGKYKLFDKKNYKDYYLNILDKNISFLKNLIKFDTNDGNEKYINVSIKDFNSPFNDENVREFDDCEFLALEYLFLSDTYLTKNKDNGVIGLKIYPFKNNLNLTECSFLLSNELYKDKSLLNKILTEKRKTYYVTFNFKTIDLTDLSVKNILTLTERAFESLLENKTDDFSVVDLKNSLIVIAGNLDECYQFSSDVNSEIDADWFYKQTLELSFKDIKSALQKRFRNEEIARFGSNHIIYQSLNKKAFEEIINHKLNVFSNIIKDKFNEKITNISYSDKIKKLIYKEGVYPVQGVRPLNGVINTIIESNFSNIVEFLINNKNKYEIKFDYINKNINVIFLENNNIIKKINTKYTPIIPIVNKKNNKDIQTAIAIHEVGHAVTNLKLKKKIPDYIFSRTNDKETLGFNLSENDELLSKRNLLNSIAVYYGGIVAEELVLGKENILEGSGSDIKKATSLITRLYRKNGFSSYNETTALIAYKNSENSFEMLHDNDFIIEEEMKVVLKESKDLAKKTIEEEKLLFVKMIEYLQINNKMNKNKIKDFVKKYAKTFSLEEINSVDNFNVNKFNEFKE